jgi:hypothetical protein
VIQASLRLGRLIPSLAEIMPFRQGYSRCFAERFRKAAPNLPRKKPHKGIAFPQFPCAFTTCLILTNFDAAATSAA